MVVYQVRYLLGQLRQDRKQKKTEQLGYVRDSKKNWEDQKNFYDQWLTLILIIQWVDVQNVTNGIRIKFRILLVDVCLLVLSAAWCNYSKSASSLYQSLSQFISPTCPKAKFRKFSIYNYANKFFHNFHLSESSFTCSGLRSSGLAQRLLYTSFYAIKFNSIIITDRQNSLEYYLKPLSQSITITAMISVMDDCFTK